VLEGGDRIRGISCTIRHNGNRLDIGGHRFFSKSDRVMDSWTELMPVVDAECDREFGIKYQNRQRAIRPFGRDGQSPAGGESTFNSDPDCVMLVRPRRSRIYFMRSFFDYPLSIGEHIASPRLPANAWIGFSYLKFRVFQRRPERPLQDFFINRFGRKLYLTFFKSYTEKVWGVSCNQISAARGAQRIKGLSLRTAVTHFLKKLLPGTKKTTNIKQKESETSLIEKFLYPKFGPGQLWEHVAKLVEEQGGEIRMGLRVTRLHVDTNSNDVDHVTSVVARTPTGELVTIPGDYFFSTMPVRELIRAIDTTIPAEVQAISDGLMYRDFITVGLLVDRLLITEKDGPTIQDTWIYIQEPEVLVGRVQIFNNWSPYLVADPSKVWIGHEYFCYDTDALWNKRDEEVVQFAIEEVARIGILNAEEVRDSCVFRVPKTYPAYFGTYDRFDEIIRYVDRYENLFLLGRNRMHKYNNQDHSMLTAMVAVDNIVAGITNKRNLWEINTEQEYQEHRKDPVKRHARRPLQEVKKMLLRKSSQYE
jgi:protoporphyrinogen oxidase